MASMFGGGGSKKNSLANRVRRAEAKARKIMRKKELTARLKKAQTVIKSGQK